MIFVLKNKGKGKYGLGENQVIPSDLERIEEPAIRLKNQTLVVTGWVLNNVTGLYEYVFSDPKISVDSEVEFIPHSGSEEVVKAAEIKTHTPVSLGQVIVQAVNAPGEDILVDVIIERVSDV